MRSKPTALKDPARRIRLRQAFYIYRALNPGAPTEHDFAKAISSRLGRPFTAQRLRRDLLGAGRLESPTEYLAIAHAAGVCPGWLAWGNSRPGTAAATVAPAAWGPAFDDDRDDDDEDEDAPWRQQRDDVPWSPQRSRQRSREGYSVTYWSPPDGKEKVLYAAQGKQNQLHACAAPTIWFSSIDGERSDGLRWNGIINCLRRGGLKVLLLCREYDELERQHLVALDEIPPTVGEYNRTHQQMVFPHPNGTGSVLQFGEVPGCEDIGTFLLATWDLIMVDGADRFEPGMLSALRRRARTRIAGIRPQIVLAADPGKEANYIPGEHHLI